MATKKKTTTSSRGKDKVEKVMGEFKRGQLKSGGKKRVTNPKQAIAIGLSEAREAGEAVPAPGRKRGATKKAAAKSAVSRGAAKKAPVKKAAAKKTVVKKAAVKKGAAKKGGARKRG